MYADSVKMRKNSAPQVTQNLCIQTTPRGEKGPEEHEGKNGSPALPSLPVDPKVSSPSPQKLRTPKHRARPDLRQVFLRTFLGFPFLARLSDGTAWVDHCLGFSALARSFSVIILSSSSLVI